MTHPTLPPSERVNRVPRVTTDFWLIKLMAVTMGETAADYLAVNLGLGLTVTSVIMTAILAVAIGLQFSKRRYVPWVYWTAVVLISVVGTLVTDNLVDNFGVPLEVTTVIFTIALIAVFALWQLSERTLSIHTIYTDRREIFYWFTILFTFALGTAAGDLIAEVLAFGYFITALLFAGVIGIISAAYFTGRMNGILAFWLAYIFTRPLGASLGDLLSQPVEYGGLGFGTIYTSLLFLCAIVAIVIYMTVTEQPAQFAEPAAEGSDGPL